MTKLVGVGYGKGSADGKVIAQYTGEIDIEGNDNGDVFFDYD